MEIDHAIIESLKVPRTYGELLQKTSTLRKRKGFGLSNEDFSNALKRLVESGIVLKPKKRGGNWSLNQDIKEMELYYREKPNEFFDYCETQIKNLEEIISHLNKNKESSKKKFIVRMQEHITDTIRILLHHQLIGSLLVGTSWSTPVPEREFKSQTKRSKEIIKKLSFLTEKLDKSGSEVTLSVLINEIQNELNDASEKEYESRNFLIKYGKL